jgi:oxygen-independent coproporphyrinogen-3 oxidase
MWEHTLEETLSLNPDHFSLYALGIEPRTAMEYWVRNEKLPAPDSDLAADMYERASERLAAAGFVQYEISNWAKPGRESRHNIQYWRNLPYLGLGPGAHGYAGGKRYQTIRSPHRYIKAMQAAEAYYSFPLTPAVQDAVIVNREDEISETIMMGMRLLQEGISLSQFEQRFGMSLLDLRGEVIETYQAQGFLNLSDDSLRLTPAGRFVSNRILRDLV